MRTYLFPSLDMLSGHLSSANTVLPIATIEQRRYIYDYAKDKSIAAETSPIFVQRTGEELRIYLNTCLCASVNCLTEEVLLTPFGRRHFERQINAGQQAGVEAEFASLAINLLSLAVSIDAGKFHEIGSEYYQIHEKQDGFLILNSFTRREDYLPSALYPMPNGLPPRLFFSENTQELDDGDRLAVILDSAGVVRRLGHAYSTVETEIDMLRKAGYDHEHSIEYYCGWATSWYAAVWTHHAWLVVDGNCVIDLTAEKIGPMAAIPRSAQEGLVPFQDQMEAAAMLKAFEAEKHSTRELIPYGRCESWCYVGVPSSTEEGIRAFRALLGNYPHHPSYMNVDKQTYTNRLNRAYYGKS